MEDYFANNKLTSYYIYVSEIYFKQTYLRILFYLQ
jgi:hypothetical protein